MMMFQPVVGAGVQAVLGSLSANAVRSLRSSGPCGRDWLSREVAWQHGSFVSARAAVTAVRRRVMAG